MASATGVPDGPIHERIDTIDSNAPEDEPLLGSAGDAAQKPEQPLYHNLIIGTAPIAQAGIILLTASVWAGILLHDLMLFSAHPLLNSTGLLLLTQSILVLQPTHTAPQKRAGTITHFTLNNLGVDLLIAGLVVIEVNKVRGGTHHFESVHGILGLTTYILLAIQAAVGVTSYFFPQVYGSVAKAKSLYKWHRLSGYLLLVLMLATVTSATKTTFNVNTLHIRFWAILVSAILVLIGVIPRIKKQKFGFGKQPQPTARLE